MGSRLVFLKKGLDVESCYYILVFVYLFVSYRGAVLLTMVLIMAVAHAAARRSLSGGPSMLRDGKRVASVLAFDIVELAFLVFLFSHCWSSTGLHV